MLISHLQKCSSSVPSMEFHISVYMYTECLEVKKVNKSIIDRFCPAYTQKKCLNNNLLSY